MKVIHYIRVQLKHEWRKAFVEDYGTLRSMHAKYGKTHLFYCANVPPIGADTGYRLDNEPYRLTRYARHKAWIESGMFVGGKPVILVSNADHARLYKKGKINLREYRELSELKAQAKNKRFMKAARRQALRTYKERERAYSKR